MIAININHTVAMMIAISTDTNYTNSYCIFRFPIQGHAVSALKLASPVRDRLERKHAFIIAMLAMIALMNSYYGYDSCSS